MEQKTENTEAEFLDIALFIKKLVSYITPRIEEKHLHLRYRTENISASRVRLSTDKMERVFEELLDMAVEMTPVGGDVILSAEELSRSGNTVTLEFFVQDTGIGMSLDDIETALAMIKPDVDKMDGRISFESRRNMGTVAHIIVNAKAAEVRGGQPVPNVSRDVFNFSGKRVLLVEDHLLNLEIAKNMLEHVGFSVDTAEDGEQAVRAFEDHGASYDVILMDIRMPVMDGVEATREIRGMEDEGSRHVPIIALTASAYEGDVNRSRQAGMDDSILKPIDPVKMYTVISNYLYTRAE